MDNTSVKKTSSTTIIIRVVLVLVVLCLVVNVVLLNWQTIYRVFVPPKPVIVSNGGDDLSSKLFDYSIKVWAEVRNDGGNGTIAMEVTFVQGERSFKKSTTRHFASLETARMELIFDEAKIFSGKPSYSIKVFPYGK